MNALSKIAQTVGMTFAPDTYQAVRGARERNQYKNALADFGNMTSSGDYAGASKAIMPYDPGLGLEAMQIGEQRQMQARDRETQIRTQDLENLYNGAAEMRQMPLEARGAFAQRLSEQFGVPMPQSMDDLTDAALDEDLAMLRTQLGMGAPEVATPEPKWTEVTIQTENGPVVKVYDANSADPMRALMDVGAAPVKTPLVQNTVTNNPTPEQYADSLLNPAQPKGDDPAIVFDADGKIRISPNQQQSAFAADATKFNEMNAKFDMAADEINRAISFIDDGGAAGAASILKDVPIIGGQTKAGGLANSLKTIMARIGFDELQAMREASPTGGALGQVSEREIDFLQSLMGSLAQDQDPTILRENLVTVRNFLAGRQQRYETAFSTRYPTAEQSEVQRRDARQTVTGLQEASDEDLFRMMAGN